MGGVSGGRGVCFCCCLGVVVGVFIVCSVTKGGSVVIGVGEVFEVVGELKHVAVVVVVVVSSGNCVSNCRNSSFGNPDCVCCWW